MRFQKLPAAALVPVRRVLDEDAEFRERVAKVATEGLAGRAGLLFLTRPEHWEEELEQLLIDEAREAEMAAAADLDRTAAKKLAAAEQAARRAGAELAMANDELGRLR